MHLIALVTLLNVLLQFALLIGVVRARVRYHVKAPAIGGHPLFERVYRVQMNTLESTLMFLPVLWLAAYYGYPRWAGIIGMGWLASRVGYAIGYMRDPSDRKFGFAFATLCWLALTVLATVGIGRAMLTG